MSDTELRDSLQKKALPGVPLLLLLLLGALTAVAPMSTDMYLPGFPAIRDNLGLAPGDVELSFSSYFVGMLLGMLCYGPVSDRFGRKLPLMFGMALYLLSAFAIAMANNLAELVSWRFIQGLGGCAGAVMTIAIVRDRCVPRDAARVMSMITLVMGSAPILAPLAGGLILEVGDWRTIFHVLGLFGLALLVGVVVIFRDEMPVRSSHLAFKPVLASYLDLLKSKQFVGYSFSQAFTSGAMFAYIVGSPFVLMDLHGVPPEKFGFFFGVNAIGLVLASQLNRLLLRRLPSDVILRGALWLPVIAGGLLLSNCLLVQSSFWLLLPGFFILVSSVGLVAPNATAMALADQSHRAGLASALHTSVKFGLGMVSGVLIGIFHNGTSLPLAAVVMVYSLCGLFFNRFLTRPEHCRLTCPSL